MLLFIFKILESLGEIPFFLVSIRWIFNGHFIEDNAVACINKRARHSLLGV